MQIEIRDNSVLIKGYVNAVERDSRKIQSQKGEFVEQVRSGTWKRAIEKNDNVAALVNHDWNKKLGSTKDILLLKEDNIGLYAELRTSDKDVIRMAKAEKLVGWSFGFKPEKVSWGKTDNEVERRYLDEIDLKEVSILDDSRTPAYYGTLVEVRDDGDICIEQRFNKDEIETKDFTEETRDQEEITKKLKLLELELEI